MEKDLDVITLEDNIEYAVVDEIEIQNIKYLFLSNINDDEDFCIRKYTIKNGEEVLTGLNDENEFDLALMHFAKKHEEDLK